MLDEATLAELGASAEALGVQATAAMLDLMADDLAQYSPKHIRQALKRLRLDGARFTTPEIIKRMPGMYPEPNEAWARMPRCESQSACVCNEMLEAWGVAAPLDEIAGRMAFIETYRRAVSVSLAEGKQPTWLISVGTDVSQRERVVLDAVRDRLISPGAAQAHLPHIPASDLAALAGNEISVDKLLEQHAQTTHSVDQLLLAGPRDDDEGVSTPEQVRGHIAALRGILES